MGNALLRYLKGASDDTPPASPPHQPGIGIASKPHFASQAAAGLALLLNFETTSQVPEGLSQHIVTLSKNAQAKLYAEILAAWKEPNHPPRAPEEAESSVTDASEDESDAESLEALVVCHEGVSSSLSWPEGVQFELHTLPVDAKLVGDGDGMIVHVDTGDPDEADAVPIEVLEAAIKRHWAQAVRDYPRADALNEIIISAGYRVINAPNGDEILAREYRIGFRYAEILAAWKEPNPPPRMPEEAASSVTDASEDESDAESLESFAVCYHVGVSSSSSLPEGVQFELHTLPVDAKLVGDGDGMIVHVDTDDPDEADAVPIEVLEAAIKRRQARAVRDYPRADALNEIIISAGYRVIKAPNGEEILAREYRIRLRGIDAPEMNMEYGPEAKDALLKLIQGKRLTIYVYEVDQYGRSVGDVYCNGTFIQEKLLRTGCAWHYKVYDKRRLFAQREARNAGRGLWANPNPVAPWEFKREERNKRNVHRQHQNRRNARRERLVRNQPY